MSTATKSLDTQKTSLLTIIKFFSKKFKKEYKIINNKKTTTLVSDNKKLINIGWRPKFNLFSTLKKFYIQKNITNV